MTTKLEINFKDKQLILDVSGEKVEIPLNERPDTGDFEAALDPSVLNKLNELRGAVSVKVIPPE